MLVSLLCHFLKYLSSTRCKLCSNKNEPEDRDIANTKRDFIFWRSLSQDLKLGELLSFLRTSLHYYFSLESFCIQSCSTCASDTVVAVGGGIRVMVQIKEEVVVV